MYAHVHVCVCACDERQARQGRARQDKARQEGARRGEAGQGGARARRGKGKAGQGQGKAREARGSCASDLATSQVSFSCFNSASLSIQVRAPFQNPFEMLALPVGTKVRVAKPRTHDEGQAGMGRDGQDKSGQERPRQSKTAQGGARWGKGKASADEGGARRQHFNVRGCV